MPVKQKTFPSKLSVFFFFFIASSKCGWKCNNTWILVMIYFVKKAILRQISFIYWAKKGLSKTQGAIQGAPHCTLSQPWWCQCVTVPPDVQRKTYNDRFAGQMDFCRARWALEDFWTLDESYTERQVREHVHIKDAHTSAAPRPPDNQSLWLRYSPLCRREDPTVSALSQPPV